MAGLFLLRVALRDLLRPRRAVALSLLVLCPALIGLMIRLAAGKDFDGVGTYGGLASLVVFGFVLPLTAVVLGTGVLTAELEEKTIVYVLTRPVRRWAILLWKYVAAWLVGVVTLALSVVLLRVVTHEPGSMAAGVRLYPEAVADVHRLCSALQIPQDPVSEYVRSRLSQKTVRDLDAWDPGRRPHRRLVARLTGDLNRFVLKDPAFYSAQRFNSVRLPEDVRQLLTERADPRALERRNRLLLEAAYPGVFRSSRTPSSQLGRDLAVLPLGAAAYTAIALLLATILRRPLITGLFLMFGWESWVPLLPGNFRLVSIMTYLRALAPHARPEAGSYGLMSLFGALNPESVSVSLALRVLCLTTLAALLLAALVFSLREYVPRDE